jgi:hypothetical protein
MNTRLVHLLGWGLLLTLAACGTPLARTASPSSSASARPAPPQAPASTTATSPSPAPAAQPSPVLPPGPVVVVKAPNGAISATAGDGTPLWGFDPKKLGIVGPTFVTAGPDLLAVGRGVVLVIDRTGTVVGRGVFPGDAGAGDVAPITPAPSGTRWAWLDGSSLWVAGLGEAPHRVSSWTGDVVVLGLWSDAGIVITKLSPTCGADPVSSVLVDPATGAEQALFGAHLRPLDVHGGVRVAVGPEPATIQVAGAAQFSRTLPIPVEAAGISPSADRLFASALAMGGCGGVARATTGVFDVATGDQTAIDGFFAGAWLDDAHLLGRSVEPSPPQRVVWSSHVQVADLSGHTSDLVLGTLVGVLHPSQ